MRPWPVAIMVALLGGCTVSDDPDNVPRRGHWQNSVRLVALTIDDRSVTREEVPFPVVADKTEDKGCSEPRLKTIDEANTTIAALAQVNCRLESLDHDRGAITGRGRCAPQAKEGITVGATFTLKGEEAPDLIHVLQELDAYARVPDGQTVRVHTAYAIDWKRLSACGR